MKTTDVYQHNEDCLLEDMDGEMLLYHPATAMTLHLNGPSAIVWQLCDGQRNAQQIIELVQEAFPEQAEQILADVTGVIDDLLEREVLQTVGQAACDDT